MSQDQITERQPYLIAACGMKGIGKTYTTMEYIREYVKGDPAKGIPGRKVLIFDVNDEYSDRVKYPDIKGMYIEHIPMFAQSMYPEIRRIRPFFDTGEKMSLDDMANVLEWIVSVFVNGLLLIEDINKYVQDNMPGDLLGAICTNRHIGCDIILHYQSIGRLNPKIWQNINFLRFHLNGDSVMRHKNKIPDKIECLMIAEKIVRKQVEKDKHFYLWVDTLEMKIHDVPKSLMKECVEEYVQQNYTTLISPHLNQYNRSGKKIHTPESAFDYEENRLIKTYFK